MGCGCKGNTEVMNQGQPVCPDHEAGCSCGNVGSNGPTPYYNGAPGIQESHDKTVVNVKYAAGLKVTNTFNMPTLEATAVLTIPGLASITVGAYLWNSLAGFLQVVSFDYVNSQVIVKNNNDAGNAAYGTPIPACSVFLVAPPPPASLGSVDIWPFVAVDFTVPAPNDTVPVTLTSMGYITIGSTVQVAGGLYSVSNVNAGLNVITLLNNGTTAVQGTVVHATDGGGNYVSPVVPIEQNPCAATPVNSGKLIVCSQGVQAPLLAGGAGLVPVSLADGSYVAASIEGGYVSSTTLAVALNLTAGTGLSFNATVVNPTVFEVGDIVQLIDQYNYFLVTAIVGTTVTVQAMGNTALQTLSAGSIIARHIPRDEVHFRMYNDAISGSFGGVWNAQRNGSLMTVGNSWSTYTESRSVSNPSYTRSMLVCLNLSYYIDYRWEVQDQDNSYRALLNVQGLYAKTVGAINTVTSPAVAAPANQATIIRRKVDFEKDASTLQWPQTEQNNLTDFVILTPRQELKYTVGTLVWFEDGSVAAHVKLNISGIGGVNNTSSAAWGSI